jgi:hypothetical protein
MAQNKGSKFTGPAIGIAVAIGVGFWLSNAKLGSGGGAGIGSAGNNLKPIATAPVSPPVKASEPVTTPTPAAPSKAAISIQVDAATNAVRYLIDGTATEPGKFAEQVKVFLEKNPSIKELTLTFPKETPAADVLAVQQVLSSFSGVTYTVGEQTKSQ